MASAPGKIRIGDLLVDAEEISQSNSVRRWRFKKPLIKACRILIEMGSITEERLLRCSQSSWICRSLDFGSSHLILSLLTSSRKITPAAQGYRARRKSGCAPSRYG